MRTSIAALIGAVLVIPATATAAFAGPAVEVSGSSVTAADRALRTHAADAKVTAGDAFQLYRTEVDARGAAHVRYTRTYHGLRVYGGDVVVHTDSTGGYAGTSNSLAAPLQVGVTRRCRRRRPAHREGELRRQGDRDPHAAAHGRRLQRHRPPGVGERGRGLGAGRADPVRPARRHRRGQQRRPRQLGRDRDVAGTGRTIYSGNVSIDTTRAAAPTG